MADINPAIDSAIDGIETLASMASAAAMASAASDLSGWLFTVSNSLAPITTTQPNKLVTSKPNFFNLAAQYYGNANHWLYIAEANGLNDPQPPLGDYTITIPPAPANWNALPALFR